MIRAAFCATTTRLIRATLAVAVCAGAFCDHSFADMPLDRRQSSYDQMTPATKAMQDDDTANPGMLSVIEGGGLWKRPAGAAQKSCADCHGEARESMTGVAARYPAYDPTKNGAINLDQRINLCRTERQQAPALPYESRELLALSSLVARQSRGAPIAGGTDERLAPAIAQGRSLFTQRQGQLNLSCAQCHNDNWGQKLAGNPVPQGHPTGYPLYRLEWQALGSLQRRLRNCMIGMRAEPYAYGSPEYVALEAFLMRRARGMTMESPAVRP